VKRIKRRALFAVAVSMLLLLGTALYVLKFLVYGGSWAASRVSFAVWQGDAAARGRILGRNGEVLADIKDGRRVFSSDTVTAQATLHVVGDAEGKIGTGAMSVYRSKLIGYSPIFGIYGPDTSGGDVTLTIDAKASAAAYRALDGRRGAVVVINYETWEVICLVSAPSFDPGSPPGDIDTNPEYEGAYLNRAISSTFTPGSTFKLVTAAAAIENIQDLEELIFHCSGGIEIDGQWVKCAGRHGAVNFETGLAHSCNAVFAELAVRLGAQTLWEYAKELGLTEPFSVGGIATASGKFDLADGKFELAWSGIGQYNDLVSPIAMTRLCGAIASGGNTARLELSDAEGISLTSGTRRLLNASTAARLKELMLNNVESAADDMFPGLIVGAKSGTAEVGGGKEPHAWFVGFLDDPQQPYAFAVIVENGGAGRTVAGAVANKVLQELVK
jgi:peptidoglycan glycosyltransferase